MTIFQPLHRLSLRDFPFAPLGLGLALSLCIGGCRSPFERNSEQQLRNAMVHSVQREIDAAKGDSSESHPIQLNATTDLTKLEIRDDHLQQIQDEYSTAGYVEQLQSQNPHTDPIAELIGLDLLGRETVLIPVSLQSVVQASVRGNLDVEFAQYGPAISQAALVEAEAVFDWTLFGSVQGQDSITPQTGASVFGGGVTRNESDTASATLGIRRSLTTGGSLSAQHDLGYTNVESSFFGSASPNPSNSSNFVLGYDQPLLDGFGRSQVMSQVYLARNAERSAVSALKGQLIASASDTERAYWQLAFAYKQVIIRAKLLDRGIEVRDDIKARRVQDARQAQVADAVARVERRRSDLLTAKTALRNASDRLKQLMNDDRMPVGSEILLVPGDTSVAETLSISLLDAIDAGITHRPEIEQSILLIDDSTIRENVAKNSRLPTLNLTAQARLLGLDDSVSDSYGNSISNRFIDDWLIGLTFEQPIGNRIGEAGFRRARLARMQSIVGYRRTVQGIVLDIKNALNAVVTNHTLISQTTLSRVASGEALRALIVEKELTNAGYSVERLNLELNQQESLANAEISEALALINYNTAMVDLYQAMGTTLSRNRIDFVVPDANQLTPGESVAEYDTEADDVDKSDD
ncbi:MAG: TolC family protein [Phycisphaerales bacterium]|nr:TolC family protein [Phycisphaerales bacterium]